MDLQTLFFFQFYTIPLIKNGYPSSNETFYNIFYGYVINITKKIIQKIGADTEKQGTKMLVKRVMLKKKPDRSEGISIFEPNLKRDRDDELKFILPLASKLIPKLKKYISNCPRPIITQAKSQYKFG